MSCIPWMNRRVLGLSQFVTLTLLVCLAAAFIRVHLRVQTTLIGYEIGKLKEDEATLLKKRSLLTMELAKITSRHYLEGLIAKPAPDTSVRKKALAAN